MTCTAIGIYSLPQSLPRGELEVDIIWSDCWWTLMECGVKIEHSMNQPVATASAPRLKYVIKASGARSTSSGGLRQTIIMRRPYRGILAWLADIRSPNKDSPAERAVAAVITMLALYDRDPRLAPRWEERFANGRRNSFPFGMNPMHQKALRAYLIK